MTWTKQKGLNTRNECFSYVRGRGSLLTHFTIRWWGEAANKIMFAKQEMNVLFLAANELF